MVYLSPQGRLLTHEVVKELVAQPDEGLILLASRYEGVDERLLRRYVDDEISIGDYVLSGGELAAMVVMDSLVRQMPGVLGDDASARAGFVRAGPAGLPALHPPGSVYNGEAVPPVLLSGNHADIQRWRLQQSLGRTWLRRPDLLARRDLTKEESRLLAAVPEGTSFRTEKENKMNLIEQLEKEEIARLGKTIPDFRTRRYRCGRRKRGRRRTQARPGF